MKKLILKMTTAAAMLVAMSNVSNAQNNLGADCGCPTVSSRPVVNLGLRADVNGNLTDVNTILYCDTIYTIGAAGNVAQKIYVSSGKTLTVNPGTVVKTYDTNVNSAASSLVVTRGGKINAAGSPTCGIVFTSILDNMDGTHPIGNRGEWGGVVVMGNAQVNRIAQTGAPTSTLDGEMFMEGLPVGDARSIYGGGATYNNNDNSGVVKYVSIRFAGVTIAANVELNGLSLGAVGSGTTIENIEIISNDDDGIEYWGGTVNVKYVKLMFVNDDGYDIDLNYDGKMQFLFALKAPAAIASGGESGFEWDGDEGTSTFYNNFSQASTGWRSHPVVYNATIIGNGSNTAATGTGTTTGNPFGISFKADAEGEIYNSIFTGFRGGVNMQAGSDSSKINYDLGLIKIGCNHFVGCTFPASAANVQLSGADSVKFFTTDNNVNTNSIADFDYSFAITSSATNPVTDNIDVVPSSNLSTVCTPPSDGFFTPANFRGAFEAGKKPWLNKWAYTSIVNVTPGLAPCPTDFTGDGVTNTSDFLIFVAQFNLSCN